MIDLLFLAYLFGALGIVSFFASIAKDIGPSPLLPSRGWMIGGALLWPAVLALGLVLVALLVVGIVLYGVSEL